MVMTSVKFHHCLIKPISWVAAHWFSAPSGNLDDYPSGFRRWRKVPDIPRQICFQFSWWSSDCRPGESEPPPPGPRDVDGTLRDRYWTNAGGESSKGLMGVNLWYCGGYCVAKTPRAVCLCQEFLGSSDTCPPLSAHNQDFITVDPSQMSGPLIFFFCWKCIVIWLIIAAGGGGYIEAGFCSHR